MDFAKLDFSSFEKERLDENKLRSLNGGDIITTINGEFNADRLSPEGDTHIFDVDESHCDYCHDY